MSTYVYRVRRGDETFYLRVLPEPGATFAPEVYAHRLLHGQGVRVPEVIHYDPRDADLGLSVMTTAATPGRAIGHDADPGAVCEVAAEAGRNLARVNAVPVIGFGFLRRDRAHIVALEGEDTTAAAFMLRDLPAYLSALRDVGLFSAAEIGAIEAVVARNGTIIGRPNAHLAHGDFDATHIFAADGVYTGLIDLGKMCGTAPLYDLAHFTMENRALLPAVLAGYAEIAPLPPDVSAHLHLLGLFIRLRGLARAVRRGRNDAYRDLLLRTVHADLLGLHAP